MLTHYQQTDGNANPDSDSRAYGDPNCTTNICIVHRQHTERIRDGRGLWRAEVLVMHRGTPMQVAAGLRERRVYRWDMRHACAHRRTNSVSFDVALGGPHAVSD